MHQCKSKPNDGHVNSDSIHHLPTPSGPTSCIEFAINRGVRVIRPKTKCLLLLKYFKKLIKYAAPMVIRFIVWFILDVNVRPLLETIIT
jgi:hypothetical protein